MMDRKWLFPLLTLALFTIIAIFLFDRRQEVSEIKRKPRRIYPAKFKWITTSYSPTSAQTTTSTVLLPTVNFSATNVITASLLPMTENPMKKWLEAEVLQGKLDRNIRGLATKLRLWKLLRASEAAKEMRDALEKQLFGWVGGEVSSLVDSWRAGRGIVITASDKYTPLALNLVRSIREVFNSTIPIMIYYHGDKDLKPDYRKVLLDYGATAVEDLQPKFDTNLELTGWDIKPYAFLACPFEEVMLLDADTVLMQSPDIFFADQGYKDTGALFFMDRGYGGEESRRQWFLNLLPQPLSYLAKKSSFYRKTSNDWQEAGVVLIDKQRHVAGSLAIGILNAPVVRDELHSFTHGDKESYWLGFEMAEESYAFMPTPAGTIGVERDYETDKNIVVLCGRVAHFDRQGNLMWFNDSILKEKYADPAEYKPVPLMWTHSTWEWAGFCCRFNPKLIPVPEGWPNLIKAPWELSEAEISHLHRLIEVFLTDPLNPQSSLLPRALEQAKGDGKAEHFFRSLLTKK